MLLSRQRDISMPASAMVVVVPPSSFFRLAPMRKGEVGGRGGRGLRLEGDITVVAGKSGGKWEIQRPGDKWLITAGVRKRGRECRSLRLPRITRATTRDGANTPRSLGRNAKLYGCETWDGDVRGCRVGDAVPVTSSHVQHCVSP